MKFESLEDVRAFCKGIESGDLVDLDAVETEAFRFPMSKEDQARLPAGFLQILEVFLQRDEAITKRLTLADLTIKGLAQAVSHLCLELQDRRDGDLSG